MGDWQIAVRSSTVAADALLRRIFASALVEDAHPKAGHYSVILGPTVPCKAGTRALSMLFVDGTAVARSRSAARVVEALAGYLGSHGADPPPDPLLRLSAAAAVGPNKAVLLPKTVFEQFSLCHLERALARVGLRLLDRPYVDVDPTTDEVVVDPPTLGIDARAVEQWPWLALDWTPLRRRYPLTALGVARAEAVSTPATRAEAVAHAITTVQGCKPDRTQAATETLASVVARHAVFGFHAHSLADTARELAEALGS